MDLRVDFPFIKVVYELIISCIFKKVLNNIKRISKKQFTQFLKKSKI